MNNNYEHLEHKIEKHYKQKDRKKRQRMAVSGKSVFLIQKLAQKHAGGTIRKINKKRK